MKWVRCDLINLKKNHFFLQGSVVLLLGTKEVINDPEPSDRPKFIEDMNETELASAVSI